MQKPQDLDSACSLAFLQDEILEGSKSVSHKKSDQPILVKNSLKSLSPQSHSNSVVKGNASPPSEDRRGSDNTRARDDRLAALRSYRRSKGLCFTCGERWSKEHKCANSVQLHIVQELLESLSPNSVDSYELEVEESNLMAISLQAISGTESATSFRIKGCIQGTEVLMLIDSGSSHSFLDTQVAHKFQGVQPLQKVLSVKVANGGIMLCSQLILHCAWWVQGVGFHTDFKLLSLGVYDVILGMDWLVTLGTMNIDWAAKWMEYQLGNKTIRIQGIQTQTEHCAPISVDKFQEMLTLGLVMQVFQLQQLTPDKLVEVPLQFGPLLTEFKDIFAETTGLPPRIPLLPNSKPMYIKPYRHNPT